jgi:hypothetical protein
MEQYNIYPVKGKDAREYLLLLGCSVGQNIMSLPNHLWVVSAPSSDVMYDVMRDNEKVFKMQYYPSNRYRIIVPAKYQVPFNELVISYNLNDILAASIVGSYRVMLQLMGGLPVQRPVAAGALKRLSDYTGHYYDLENVRVVLADPIAPDYTVARK